MDRGALGREIYDGGARLATPEAKSERGVQGELEVASPARDLNTLLNVPYLKVQNLQHEFKTTYKS